MEPTVCETCIDIGYGTDLWQRLTSTDWMADTGIPLVATFLGLIVAYVFLRHQISTDRDLRRADHRREAATELGNALLTAANNLSFYPYDGSGWRSSAWPDRDSLQTASGRVSMRLPNTALLSAQLVKHVGTTWGLCWWAAMIIDPPMEWHKQATRAVLGPALEVIATSGERLLAWDGDGQEPDLPELVAYLENTENLLDRNTQDRAYRAHLREIEADERSRPEAVFKFGPDWQWPGGRFNSDEHRTS